MNGLLCPNCQSLGHYVIESRRSAGSSIRRRRKCGRCDFRFTTKERVEEPEMAEAINLLRSRPGTLKRLIRLLRRHRE